MPQQDDFIIEALEKYRREQRKSGQEGFSIPALDDLLDKRTEPTTMQEQDDYTIPALEKSLGRGQFSFPDMSSITGKRTTDIRLPKNVPPPPPLDTNALPAVARLAPGVPPQTKFEPPAPMTAQINPQIQDLRKNQLGIEQFQLPTPNPQAWKEPGPVGPVWVAKQRIPEPTPYQRLNRPSEIQPQQAMEVVPKESSRITKAIDWANTPLVDYDPTLKAAMEQMNKDYPFTSHVGQMLSGLPTGATSPLGLALEATTAGGSAAYQAGKMGLARTLAAPGVAAATGFQAHGALGALESASRGDFPGVVTGAMEFGLGRAGRRGLAHEYGKTQAYDPSVRVPSSRNPLDAGFWKGFQRGGMVDTPPPAIKPGGFAPQDFSRAVKGPLDPGYVPSAPPVAPPVVPPIKPVMPPEFVPVGGEAAANAQLPVQPKLKTPEELAYEVVAAKQAAAQPAPVEPITAAKPPVAPAVEPIAAAKPEETLVSPTGKARKVTALDILKSRRDELVRAAQELGEKNPEIEEAAYAQLAKLDRQIKNREKLAAKRAAAKAAGKAVSEAAPELDPESIEAFKNIVVGEPKPSGEKGAITLKPLQELYNKFTEGGGGIPEKPVSPRGQKFADFLRENLFKGVTELPELKRKFTELPPEVRTHVVKTYEDIQGSYKATAPPKAAVAIPLQDKQRLAGELRSMSRSPDIEFEVLTRDYDPSPLKPGETYKGRLQALVGDVAAPSRVKVGAKAAKPEAISAEGTTPAQDLARPQESLEARYNKGRASGQIPSYVRFVDWKKNPVLGEWRDAQLAKAGPVESIVKEPDVLEQHRANWKEQLEELDADGAEDIEYRDILSTGGREPLKKGETWRSRVVSYITGEPALRTKKIEHITGTTLPETITEKPAMVGPEAPSAKTEPLAEKVVEKPTKYNRRGFSGRFLKKDMPIEADAFERQMTEGKPAEPTHESFLENMKEILRRAGKKVGEEEGVLGDVEESRRRFKEQSEREKKPGPKGYVAPFEEKLPSDAPPPIPDDIKPLLDELPDSRVAEAIRHLNIVVDYWKDKPGVSAKKELQKAVALRDAVLKRREAAEPNVVDLGKAVKMAHEEGSVGQMIDRIFYNRDKSAFSEISDRIKKAVDTEELEDIASNIEAATRHSRDIEAYKPYTDPFKDLYKETMNKIDSIMEAEEAPKGKPISNPAGIPGLEAAYRSKENIPPPAEFAPGSVGAKLPFEPKKPGDVLPFERKPRGSGEEGKLSLQPFRDIWGGIKKETGFGPKMKNPHIREAIEEWGWKRNVANTEAHPIDKAKVISRANSKLLSTLRAAGINTTKKSVMSPSIWDEVRDKLDYKSGKMMRNYFTQPGSETFHKIANVAKGTTNIALTGGLPGRTGHVSAHAWNVARSDIQASGYVKGIKNYFKGSIDPQADTNYVQSERPFIKKLIEHGMSPDIEGFGFGGPHQTGVDRIPYIGEANIYRKKVMEDPLFKTHLPAIKIKQARMMYDRLIKQGATEKVALRRAAEFADDFSGSVNKTFRNKTYNDLLRSTILAPDWVQSRINIARKGLTGKAGYVAPLLRGATLPGPAIAAGIAAKGISGYLSQKPVQTTGIPIGESEYTSAKGKTRMKERTLDLLGTADEPTRALIHIGSQLKQGNLLEPITYFFNKRGIPISTVAHLIANEDAFGNTLSGVDQYTRRKIPPLQAGLNIANEFTRMFTPSFVQSLVDVYRGKASPEEAFSKALELPISYSFKTKKKSSDPFSAGGLGSVGGIP
jgi:hypothetical protein